MIENFTPLEYFVHVTLEDENPEFDSDVFIRSIVHATGFDKHVLFSSSRRPQLVSVRNLICLVLKKNGYTWEAIGSVIKKHHSTALTGCEVAKSQRGVYPVQDQYERLFNSLGYEPF